MKSKLIKEILYGSLLNIKKKIFLLYRCPKNFTPINRTYDQDSDADLWRESILFGRQTTRYLCLSKTEGLPEYVVETLKYVYNHFIHTMYAIVLCFIISLLLLLLLLLLLFLHLY